MIEEVSLPAELTWLKSQGLNRLARHLPILFVVDDFTEGAPNMKSQCRSGYTTSRSAIALVSICLPLLLTLACGPPAATLAENYEAKPDGPHFDHSALGEVLGRFVDTDGWVDYAGLSADTSTLDRYIQTLATAPFDELGRDEKLALLINAYNAFTLRLILDHYPLDSIKDIPSNQRWDGRAWNLAGNSWTLTQIEHEQIRPKFKEPRVHFAINCASIGCPPLADEPYLASTLDQQLESQMRYTHSHDRWLRYDATHNTVWLTQLYNWYSGDFEQVAGTALAFAADHAPALNKAIESGKTPQVKWLDYSWKLNDQKNKTS